MQDKLSLKQHMEMQIRDRLGRLRAFSREAQETPFDFHVISDGQSQDTELPQTKYPGFISHHIVGNRISAANAIAGEALYKNQPVDTKTIDTLQGQAINLLSQWGADPTRTSESIEKETNEVLLEATQSFHWASNPGSLARLNEISDTVATDISALFGKKTI